MYGSLNISVSGISAQDAKMGSISANIANSSTVGYKGIGTAFSTLLDGYEHGGGVVHKARPTVATAGRLENSQVITDIALEGEGMIPVNSEASGKGEILYTREGSFRKDKNGNLSNIAGAYLMALPFTFAANTLSFDAMEVINLNQGIGEVTPTQNVNVSLNLDATEEPAKGIAYNFLPNTGFDPDALLYDTRLHISDGMEFDIGNASYSLVYDGLCAGVSPTPKDVFGAKDTKSEMTALKEGDGFAIIDDAGTRYEFKFKKGITDLSKGEFNTLQGLSSAIESFPPLKSSIINDVFCVGPRDSFSGMRFNNLSPNIVGISSTPLDTVYSVQQFYRSITSADLVTAPVHGANSATAPFTLAGGATVGDGLSITMSDGIVHNFLFTTSATPAGNQFNNLTSLSTAIAATTGLKSNINGASLNVQVAPGTDVTINSIQDTGPGASTFATALGLALDTKFGSSSAQDGDKLTVDFGMYEDVQAVPNNNYVYTNSATILGSEVKGATVSAATTVFGATTTAAVFTTTGLADGDGIKITSDRNNITIKYKGTTPNTTNGEFNSMDTMVAAIKAIGSSTMGIDARIDNGSQIVVFATAAAGLSQQIYKIEDANLPASTSNFATGTKLITNSMPRVSESITVVLDDDQKFNFVFTGHSTGSAANGAPDYMKQEFNNFDTFAKAVSYATGDQLQAVINNSSNTMDLKVVTTKCLSKIFSVGGTGGLADFMGFNVSSPTLDFTYSTAAVPNIAAGEFNSIPTLIQAMKKFSGGLLVPSMDANNIMHIDVSNGGKINFIRDKNVLGVSNFATNFGLDGYDAVSAFGLRNISNVSGKRFNKLSDLVPLLNKSLPTQTATLDAGEVHLTANSVLDKFTIANVKGLSAVGAASVSSESDFLGAFKVGPIATDPLYIADDQTRNMSSSSVTGDFTSNVIDLYDSLGIKHALISHFMKIGKNEWVMEIAAKPDEITSATGRTDGLLGYANMRFDGSGAIQSILFTDMTGAQSSSIEDGYSIPITWNNGADTSTIKLGFGETNNSDAIFGKNNGLFVRQVSSDYFYSSIRDGSGSGSVTGVDIAEDGTLSMHFSDGEVREIYKIPIVRFSNYNGLTLLEGNIYAEGSASGKGQLAVVGSAVSGRIRSYNLESANVEVLNELTSMIPTQHAYYANSKVIQTITKMLDELRKLE